MIKFENVCISYQKNETVFENLSICFEEPGIYIIVGESGIGKSTLINAALGGKQISSGTICYNDVDIHSISNSKRSALKKNIGYVPQNYSLIDSLSVLDNVCIASVFDDPQKELHAEREKALKLLETLHIKHLMNTSTGRISGGEKRRVEIARAMMKGTHTVIMDEPTNNLDDASVLLVKELITENRSKGVLTIISTHDPRIMDIPDAKIVSVKDKTVIISDE